MRLRGQLFTTIIFTLFALTTFAVDDRPSAGAGSGGNAREEMLARAQQRALEDSLLRAQLAERARYYGVFIGNRTSSVFSRRDEGGHGSGFIWKIDAEKGKGYIISNDHVAGKGPRDAQELAIGFTIPGAGVDRYVPGRLVLTNYTSDAALIEFDLADVASAFGLPDTSRLPFLVADVATPEQEEALIRVGNEVFAIGNPLDGRDTVTYGRITELPSDPSSREREENPINYMVKTDAAINPGNSGGPVMHISDIVIGIATRKNTRAEGTGYFIPISRVIWEIERLLKQGTLGEGFLDIHIAPVGRSLLISKGSFKNIPPEEAKQIRGLLLINDAPEGSGLITGDVIFKVDGQIFPPDPGAFELMVATTSEKKLNLVVLRNNEQVPVEVPIRHFGRDQYRQNNHFLSIAGYVFQDLTHIQRASLNLAGGIMLTDYVPITHAAPNGEPRIPMGSVITEVEINGVTYPVPTETSTRSLNITMLRHLLEKIPEGGSFGIYLSVPVILGRMPNGDFVYKTGPHGVPMLSHERHYVSIPRQKLITHREKSLGELKETLDFSYTDARLGAGLLGELMAACQKSNEAAWYSGP